MRERRPASRISVLYTSSRWQITKLPYPEQQKLVITELDVQMVDLYVQYIRPVQIANNTSNRLLVLSGGRDFNNFNQRSRQIFNHFRLKPISATRSRKLASTAAATKLDPKDSLMTARHLSHLTETEVLHYHAFASASHSAKAVELIHQATVKDSSDTSEDEVEKEATNSLDTSDTTRKRRREDSPMVIHKKKRVVLHKGRDRTHRKILLRGD